MEENKEDIKFEDAKEFKTNFKRPNVKVPLKYKVLAIIPLIVLIVLVFLILF